ncbi:MAG: hypothetical protein NC410_11685 [Oscillibacter sp.]|nr:hypothetical protein [Oscillibacter sp.]
MLKEKLIETIETYVKSHAIKSSNVYLLDDITPKLLALHQKRYAAQMGNNERPLLVVNKSILGTIGGYGWSGLLITDKKIYYKCIKDAFYAGLVALSVKGEIPLEQISSINIGEHDACFGVAYMGHQLVINGKVLGLLRMGGSVEFDDKAIEELNQIFHFAI